MADRFEPTLYPNGVRPVGGTERVTFDVKCACGVTAIPAVVTSAWGIQCPPCYEASRKALDSPDHAT